MSSTRISRPAVSQPASIDAPSPDGAAVQRKGMTLPPGYLAYYGIQGDIAGPSGDADAPVQAKAAAAPGGDPAEVHESARRGTSGAGGPLPFLSQIQDSFGRHDIQRVQAHTDGQAATASAAMSAHAFTTGDHVAFAAAPDLHTAAHEAAHVVQQRAGVHLKGGVGEVGDPYERHADAVADLVVQGKSSEAALDDAGYARGAASTASVQRVLSQPIVTPAPASAISIRDFILLVETEERGWPAAEQTQTALMISRLRKIFYGTSGWDKYLIPGAASVSSGYNISEEETGRETLDADGPNADIVRRRQVTTDSSGATPAIARQQEVRLEDGSFCDVGHVFAGLDAINHPTSISAPLGIATVSDNVGAVTWVGDLGSVLAEAQFQVVNRGRSLTDAEIQPIINEYASPQDMLGNIDAYAMAAQYNITNAGGRKVSELLRAFYLGATTTADGRAREHRYSTFCTSTGLTGWSGGSFSNESAWIARWTPEVGAAAALYVGANTEGVLSLPWRGGFVIGIQSNTFARTLVELFLAALKTRVAAEPP